MPESFDEFYRSTSRRVLQYAYALTTDIGAAQDLTQDAYLRAWRRWSQVSRYERPDVWVRVVLTRLATDRWRRLKLGLSLSVGSRPPDPIPPPSDDTVVLVAALRTLPVQQRRAVSLHYLLDLSIAEIAAEAEVPEGTVKSWLARGRAALAARLGPQADSVPDHRSKERRNAV
jgi:RNA polymerase sigma-70 factor, ECF subfamily